jgi:peptidase C25-like protein/concanavalin A-like lectin/glucanase superfamily protein/uncharacterized protein DUF1573
VNKKILAMLLLFPLFLSAITNQFQVETTIEKTILRMPLYNSEADSVYHKVLPVIDGRGYSIDNSLNCSAALSPVMRMRDMEFSVLTIEPELGLASGDTICVELDGSCEEGITFQKPAGSFLKMYISMFPEMAERENWRDIEPARPSILYICPDDVNILTYLDYLAVWKKQRGYQVTVANTTQTGTTSTSIKIYIQNAYDNWDVPPEYICLVGDADGDYTIPTNFYPPLQGHGSGEGDHQYTELAGNDLISDVHIGRLSISSIADLQTIASRTIDYEKEPLTSDLTWFNQVLLTGDPTDSGLSCIYTCVNIKELIYNNHPEYSFCEVYDGSFVNQMENSINGGVSFFTYRGYNNMSGWTPTTADFLQNGSMLPFVVIPTCDTGSFFDDEICRSESFIRAGNWSSPKGGIGAIGTATIETNTCFNNCFAQGVAYGLYAEDLKTMGAAHTRGKVSLWEGYPDNPDNQTYKFNCWNNLMGDPSEEIWIGEPLGLELDIESEEHYSSNQNSIIVKAENDNGYGVEGLYACLFYDDLIDEDDDEQYFSFTDENGYAFFDISGRTSNQFKLTVSGKNYYPVQSDIFLNIDENLEITNLIYNDVSSNGSFEPGEAGELNFYLDNTTINDISQVEVTIESISDEITIEDGEITIGLIGQTPVLLAGITINYLGCGDLSECNISISIESQECSYSDSYIVPLTFLELSLYTSAFTGYSGDIPDPGETMQFDYTIQNTGDYEINGITFELTCNSNFITFSPSSYPLGDLDPQESYVSTTTPFTIDISDEFIPETDFVFTLILSNEAGFWQEIDVSQTIGTAGASVPTGPDEFGYCIFDASDTGYQDIDYLWVEINTTTALPLDPEYTIGMGDQGTSWQVNLPFDFRFYGKNYDELTVCSNGWVAPGYSESVSYMNRPIPGDGGVSPMIAVFWDDLIINANSGVYTSYQNNTLIIEWDNLENDYGVGNEETFQLIIYDRAYYPTSNGNNEMKFQYKEFNNVNVGSYSGGSAEHGLYSTIGIEDQTGTIGVQYSFNNDYFETGNQLDDLSALLVSGATIPSNSCWLVMEDLHYNQVGEVVLPGTTVNLSFDLKNSGSIATGDITITLSCDHEEYIDLTASEITVSAIAAGYTEEDITGLSFDISEDFPLLETLRFNLNFQCNEMSWDYISIPDITASSIFISEDIIDFGEVFRNYQKEYVLEIGNLGAEDLELTDIDIDCTGLQSDFTIETLESCETRELLLTYQSGVNGDFEGSITIYSNSVTNSEYTIPVIGAVVDPPEIEVQEITDFSVLIDEITSIPISISNVGEANFEFSAHLEGYYINCADFDGGYLSLPANLLEDDDFTIEAWVRVDGAGFGDQATNTLYEQRKAEATGQDDGALICFFVRTGNNETRVVIKGYETSSTVLTATAPALREWHHYAVTVDANSIKLYIDDRDPVTATNTVSSGDYTSEVEYIDLGCHQYDHEGHQASFLNGAMDEVRFWDDVRTEQEIYDNMFQVVDPGDDYLIAYWRFDDTNNWDDLVQGPTIPPVTQVNEVSHQISVVPNISLENNDLEIASGESDNLILQVDANLLRLNHVYEANLILEANDYTNYPDLTIPITITVVDNGTGTSEEIITHNIINQNYPNPFIATNNIRTGTVIEYALQEDISQAEIAIYNIRGQKVRSYVLNPEEKRCGEIIWDGRNSSNIKVGTGVYCYALKANGVFSGYKKMLLLH